MADGFLPHRTELTFMKLAIVVPTYNEVANVEALLRGVRDASMTAEDLHTEVLIVDDGSPDGTAELARRVGDELSTDDFTVSVLDKPTKEGFGAACIYGYTHLLDRDDAPDAILQMDADLSHNPKYIPGFVHAAREGADFVNASRYIPGGGTPDWSWNRRFLSRGGNGYSRLVLGRRVSDYTGGFALYRADLLRRIRVGSIATNGYGFQLVLKHRASQSATKIAEIPIVFMDREHGSSKMPSNTLWKNFWLVLSMRVLGKNL
jgi:dolichol-phosphate mannosyltransferase